ncbi:MAG TPA: UTP--glucose-1-phosphate uridylyltransferase [Terriglobales bacterium]|nr:UTP--glucose-1-phosphate uridylyltransferase [Terriglobales bacterium]
MGSSPIRKAVIPAAGLGIRFLPVTKVVPKEMLPVAARPLIQYAVEEAAASGIESVVLVVSRGKGLLAEYFHRNRPLENALARRGQEGELEAIRRLSELVEIRTVWQQELLGLADAVRTARSFIGDAPFAVILPDALIDAPVPCLRQMMDCYEQHRGCIVATQMVEPAEVERYGILDVMPMRDPCCGGRTMNVTSLIERPRPGTTASRYGVFGRYILEPEIFASIEHTRPGFNGELQLTDALNLCSAHVPLYAYCFEGRHYDAGSKLGLLQANIAYTLKDPELSGPLREHLLSLQQMAFNGQHSTISS